MKENDDMKPYAKMLAALGGLLWGALLMHAIVFWTRRYLAGSAQAQTVLFVLSLSWPVGSLFLRLSKPKWSQVWYHALWFGWWFIPIGAGLVFLTLP